MCMSSPSVPAPIVQAAPAPVAPVAPTEAPKPMALADATAGSSASRRGGISQLRIASSGGAGVNPSVLGTGAAAQAGLTLKGRKDQLYKQITAAGG